MCSIHCSSGPVVSAFSLFSKQYKRKKKDQIKLIYKIKLISDLRWKLWICRCQRSEVTVTSRTFTNRVLFVGIVWFHPSHQVWLFRRNDPVPCDEGSKVLGLSWSSVVHVSLRTRTRTRPSSLTAVWRQTKPKQEVKSDLLGFYFFIHFLTWTVWETSGGGCGQRGLTCRVKDRGAGLCTKCI